jgi:hypothetical protein
MMDRIGRRRFREFVHHLESPRCPSASRHPPSHNWSRPGRQLRRRSRRRHDGRRQVLEADLGGADLGGADLQGTTVDPTTAWPDGIDWQGAGVRVETNPGDRGPQPEVS